MIIFRTVFKLWSAHKIASETIKGFLYATHRHDLFNITVKYHDYISKGIQVTERTRVCIKKSIKGEITQKVLKRGLSFLYATHRHDLFYMTVKCHKNIPNNIQVIVRTRKCLRTDRQMPGSLLYSPNLSVGE